LSELIQNPPIGPVLVVLFQLKDGQSVIICERIYDSCPAIGMWAHQIAAHTGTHAGAAEALALATNVE